MPQPHRIRPPGSLALRAPDGSTVELTSVLIELIASTDRVTEVRLSGALTGADWARVDAGRWLSMPPAVRGPCFGGDFTTDKPVEVEARLSSDALTLLSLTTDDVQEVEAELLAPTLNPGLHETEAWLGCIVKQHRGPGPLKGGFVTRHHRS